MAVSVPNPLLNRPVFPGESDTFRVSLRLGPAGTAPAKLAADILAEFRARFPLRLSWSGRRPIGALHLSTSESYLLEAVRRGDILLFHGWYDNPNNHLIRQIYQEAGRKTDP